MVILAVDTATREGSLAIVTGSETFARAGDAARTHGERLPDEALAWLADHGHTLADVGRFAVIAGPGSFTGLRVGMAAVQGLALPGRREVVPVPTLGAMARGFVEHAGWPPGGLVAACLDGQRGDVFYAAWQPGSSADFESARPCLEPAVGPAEQMVRDLEACRGIGAAVLVGNGARRYAGVVEGTLPDARIEDVPVPLAAVAARLALARPDLAVSPHALRPIYIRRPDAVLARERAQPMPPTPEISRDHSDDHVDFEIRRASTIADFNAVEALQRRAFTSPWGAEAIRWELENTDVARLYIMREPGGGVVAYCACWMVFDELHINSLAVDEDWRRRGLASRLLSKVFRDATKDGARSATLEVRQSNQAARDLYERLGFRVEAVRRDYYQQPREDALILWHRRLAE
jgi:ribosomal-protein-alanine N-acetyltransferase